MKIGMFTDTYHPQINGVVTTIDAWKKELEKRGHEVVVVYPGPLGNKKDGIAVPSVHVPFYGGYYAGVPYGRIHAELRSLDVVHTHSPFALGAYGAYVASKFRLPRIATHNTPIEEYVHYMISRDAFHDVAVRMYLAWQRRYMALADTVTAPTQEAAHDLQRKIGRRVVVMSNGIDTERFKRVSAERFKRKHGLSGPLVGFAGRHSAEKRLEDLIAAADEIDATVVITGDGPMRRTYERMAKGKNVVFTGFLPDEEMPGFYSALETLVLPSVAETQGLVVLEANACGTPVVGARAAALRNTIKPRVNGFLYEPGDVGTLAKLVAKAMEGKARMASRCVKEAESHSVKRTADNLEEIYERARYKEGKFNHSYLYEPFRVFSYGMYRLLG